jgi:ubiquinone/menaquinone biosynthesis C-methylase UbiE
MSEVSRVTRSKAEAAAAYDRLSRWYDILAGGSETKHRNLGLTQLNAQPGETVLEVGFGTGRAVVALARSVGESGRVCGVDLSEGMRTLALARVRRAGFSARVDLKCGDAVQLPFDSDTFDALFMCFTLELFDTPEIPVVLGECRRVLRPDGRLCTVTLASSQAANPMLYLYEWAHRTLPRFVDCRPIRAQQSLEGSGFAVAKVSNSSMWGLPVSIILSRKSA